MTDLICGYIITATPKKKKDCSRVGHGPMAYGTSKDDFPDRLLFDRGATVFHTEEQALVALKCSLSKEDADGATWPAMLFFSFHQVRIAPFATQTLNELAANGHLLILWTMRSGEFLGEAIDWFRCRGIPLYGIQKNPAQAGWTSSPKCYAHVYIDDAAFGAPMIHPEGFARPCIDWRNVRAGLVKGCETT